MESAKKKMERYGPLTRGLNGYLLTNYAMDSESRLCLLFCGQSELRRRLGMAVHEALSQRIVVRYHLPPLSRDETAQYIAHLLRRAGTELPLFEPAAVEAIF